MALLLQQQDIIQNLAFLSCLQFLIIELSLFSLCREEFIDSWESTCDKKWICLGVASILVVFGKAGP